MKFTQYIKENKEELKRWNQYLKSNKMLNASIKIMKKIEKAGFKSWIVGGTVRDIILGFSPKDVDLATTMPIEKLETSFKKVYDIGKSRDFGIVVVKQDGYDFEVAQLRNDGSYTNGRKPDSVSFNVSLDDDLSRRDLTINAMAIKSDGSIVDKFNGKKDILNKIIRTVGNPFDRFEEDHLRMLRAIRFSSKLGFKLDKDTVDAIKSKKAHIKKISIERVKEELVKMASQAGDKFANAIIALDDVGILEIILPEITKLKDFPEERQFHPESYIDDKSSVFNHVMAALRKNKLTDPIINLSILFHDIGKGTTYKNIDGKHTFHKHASEAKDLIDNVAKKLKLSNKEKNAIMFSAVNHMKFHRGIEMKASKITKLVSDENWNVLKAVSLCDDSCRTGLFDKKRFNDIINKMEAISKKWSDKITQSSLKIIDGKRVMKLTGRRSGKSIGEIIGKVTGWVVDDGNKIPINDLIMKAHRELKE